MRQHDGNVSDRHYGALVRYDDPLMRDHRVFDVRILPGVCLVDLVCRIAVSRGLALAEIEVRQIQFIEPVATTESFDRRLRLSFRTLGDESVVSMVTVESQAEKDGVALETAWRLHARCQVMRVPASAPPSLDAGLRAGCDRVTLPFQHLYDLARQVKIVHGEFYQPLGVLSRQADTAVARLYLNPVSQSYASDFLIHPAYLDGSTLVPFFLHNAATDRLSPSPYVPFYIESFRLWQRSPATCYVWVPCPDDTAPGATIAEAFRRDILLFDAEGNPVAAMRHCALKRIRDAAAIQKLTEVQQVAPSPVSLQPIEPPLEQPIAQENWTDYIRHLVAELLDTPGAPIPAQTGFYDLGLDSTHLLRLAQRIEQDTGHELYPTLLFEYPNVEALAGYLGDRFGPLGIPVSTQTTAPEPEPEPTDTPVSGIPVLRVFEWHPDSGTGWSLEAAPVPLVMLAHSEDWTRLQAIPALGGRDRRVLWVEPGARFAALGDDRYQVNPARRADFNKLLAAVGAVDCLHLVHLWNHDRVSHDRAEDGWNALVTGFESVVLLEQSLLALRPVPRILLLYGTTPEGPPSETAIAAHFRTVALESPSLRGRVVEVSCADLAQAVVQELQIAAADSPFEVRYQAGRLCRIARTLPEAEAEATPIRPGGVYWITGGGGGLGLVVARWLVQAGARVLMTGRSPVKATIQQELDRSGGSLVYRPVDVTDAAALQVCLQETIATWGALRGVIHAAGIKDDKMLVNKDLPAIERVLAAKLFGTVQLDAVTQHQPLDFFVLFSSISAVVGNIGQSDYAYANGFLDRFAEQRERQRTRGLRQGRTIAIAWPPIDGGGMQISAAKQRELHQRHGLAVLPIAAILQALERVLRGATLQGAVVVWSGAIEDESAAVPLPEPLIPLSAAGVRQPLPGSLISDTGNQARSAIAIIGMSGRFPQAATLQAFWQNLATGRDCITEMPASRWQSASGGEPSGRPWGGFLDGFDCFDPLFFQISPRDARLMDPQERLFLEIAWSALEDAGYSRERLAALHSEASGGGVGVFAGVMWHQYQLFRQQTGLLPASWSFSVANRVSHFFDFHGPSVTLDTACSSSLLAVHLACESIRRGECSLALAGGVNLSLHPDKYHLLEQMQMLSRTGRCRSFAAGADGYVAGEGVGAVVLCSLEQALANRDAIYGVIRGSAVNHNGKTGGYTVPHPRYQAKVIEAALRRSGVQARQISHIEAHGTGTALGDPIEIAGLTTAFAQDTSDRGFCALSSVKSNIGHLEAAAGVAALIKVLLEMRHKLLVPSLHCAEPNPAIAFDATPFSMQRQLAPWVADGERIAGISSFGAGGVNVHLIVAEPPARSVRSPEDTGTQDIALSAHTPEALRRYADAMAVALDSADLSLADLAFTLQRRDWMEQRLHFTATSLADCRDRLRSLAQMDSLPLWTGDRATLRPSTGTLVTGLPTYPFERQRYWVADSPSAPSGSSLPPSLPVTTFTATDAMLRDHRVQSQNVVPGAAFLTLLFDAIAPESPQQIAQHWSGVTFLAPAIVADQPLQVRVVQANAVSDGWAYHVSAVDGRIFCRATYVSDVAGTTYPAEVNGIADLNAGLNGAAIELDAIELDAIEIDRLFRRRGIDYGPTCRRLDSIWVQGQHALGKLRPAGGDSWAMLDAALQVAGILLEASNQLFVPSAIDQLWLLGDLTTVRVIRAHCLEQTVARARFDLSALDDQGAIVVHLQGVCLRAAHWTATSPEIPPEAASETVPDTAPNTALTAPEDRLRLVQPVWRSLLPARPTTIPAPQQNGVVIVSAIGRIPDSVRTAAAQVHGTVRETVLGNQLPQGKFPTIWYLAGTGDEAAIALFHLIAHLQTIAPAPEPLELRVLTQDAWAVSPTDCPVPGAASVAGLVRTIAAEHPHWRVCGLDVSAAWLQTGTAARLVEAFDQALAASHWRDLCLRSEGLYERVLEAVELSPRRVNLRPAGVYVILGGAGGVGAALAEHFAAQTSVRLVLVGRRAIDPSIRALLQRLQQAGSEALYLSGDITNAQETAQIFDQVRSRFGSIHGVVYSAIVLKDGSLARLTEAEFRAAFEVKAAGTRSLDQATRQDRLDFLLFFSSLNAFAGNAGQGNYVAGCAYQDAYAARMRQERLTVRVVVCNWGYWGETGVVASPQYRARLQRQGIGAIATAEGLAACDRLLSSDYPQVAIFKATDAVCTRLGCVDVAATAGTADLPTFYQGFEALEHLAAAGLSRVVQSVEAAEVMPQLRRLRSTVLASLASQTDFRDLDEAALRQQALQSPGVAAWLRLLDRCLTHGAAVLRGELRATEVLFSDGAAALVAGVYQGNPPADQFSQQMAATIQLQTQHHSGAVLRVLEVGAGTGASTRAVLQRMGADTAGLEYWFTDLSPTLVHAAERQLGPAYPCLRFRTLDIEQPEAEGLPASFDVIAAANVIHATRDIRRSLTQIQRLLKPGGRLLLNELTQGCSVLTATFGLTDGWWAFEDDRDRLPGSPLLSCERWQALLAETGFTSIQTTELEPGHAYRQALLEAVKAPVTIAPPKPENIPTADPLDLRQWQDRLRSLVAACLQMPSTQIDDDRRFAEYGLDSISAVDLIRAINQTCALSLRTTVLFDYPSVRSLALHLSQEHQPLIPDAEPLPSLPGVVPAMPPESRLELLPEAIDAPAFPHAVWLDGPSTVAELRLQRQTIHPPAVGEVQIAVQACSLNFGDLLCIQGLYPTMPPYPFTPGFEVSGRIIAVGAGVQDLQPGDEVVSILGESMGGLAQVVNAAAWLTVRKPALVSHEIAAAFPVAWLTAHCALQRAKLRPGETILIQTAAGGTGLHAVRMALALGAEVFATAGSQKKLAYLQRLGVQHTIAYRETDFQTEVLRLTHQRGVDVVLNTLAGEAIPKGMATLAPGGRYVELAMTAWKAAPALDLSHLVDNQTILSLDLRRLLLRRSPEARALLDAMTGALAAGAGEGMVDRVFPWNQLRQAFHYLESRESIGKLVLTLPDQAVAPPASVPFTAPDRDPADRDLADRDLADRNSANTGSIAIVGMSGRFPGARNLEQFWANLRSGVSACGPVPPERWDVKAYHQTGNAADRGDAQFGAFLDDIHEWDSLFFHLTGAEAQFMSPEQRLFLEEAWKAIEDAGIPDRELDGSNCGVFAAAGSGDYADWLAQAGHSLDGHILTGNHAAILAARVSYLLNLKGTCLTVDTACSSSLVAIELACRALQSGQCDTAIAGGVFIMHTPRFHRLCGKAGMLSPSGKLQAFAAGADGFVPGEGVGVVVLKRLEDAIQNHDRIHGVIRGIAVNQDGHSNGITAPSSQSQSALERQVYATSGIDPATLTLVEAHGTGTALGDPIEVEALTRSFRERTAATGFCAIGSVKPNIGHTVYAAGVAAVIKVLLCLRHRQLPPSLHVEQTNPQIAFETTPFQVHRNVRDWQAPRATPLRAAVSSFGFSGTNCHAVLEEPPRAAIVSTPAELEPQVFLVSAKSAAALRDRLRDLAQFLEVNPAVPLRDLAATLATRRSHFPYRAAFVATQADELRQQLLTGTNTPSIAVSQPASTDLVQRAATAIGNQRTSLLRELAAAYCAAAELDWERLYPKHLARPLSLPAYPFRPVRCSPLPPAPSPSARSAPDAQPETQPETEGNGAITIDAAVNQVRGLLAAALAVPPQSLNLFDSWNSLGLDSLLIKKLNGLLTAQFGPLPASLFFEQRNLHDLTQFLLKQAPEHFQETPPPLHPSTPNEIAIIGLAGRYPGARTIDEFWTLLSTGGDAIQEVPTDRWDHEQIYDPDRRNPAATYTRWGGFLEGVDQFDPLFFGISPREAECMDPQERLFLEVCWHALEDAAYTPSALSAGRVDLGARGGVFVGVTWGSYQLLAAEAWAKGRVVIPGASHWTVANRVSHVLNWSGPSLTVDTACSSSLVAVHLACDAIQRGDCDLALAGGVNLYLHPSKYVGLSQQQFASSDGRCRSFGLGGDGFVPGEGVGAVLLKPLAQAIADGDRIYGVIRGSSVTHGGRTHGYTVPNPVAQATAIQQSLEQAGLTAESISYVEAHGTGTELGDPVEIAALSRVFGGKRATGDVCAIGSVKSNIGHLESAAGIAGLTKVLLQLKYGKLLPSLHGDPPNPAIAFEQTCFRLQHQLADWTAAGVRRAGVSSFGAGGANAHLIVEEFCQHPLPASPLSLPQIMPQIMPLSAVNEERLRALVTAIVQTLTTQPKTDLASLAATLQRGREPLGCRLAIVTESIDSLVHALRQWLAGTPEPLSFTGTLASRPIQAPPTLVRQVCPQTQHLLDSGDLPAVARRWVEGAEVHWQATGAIMSLPGYPFLRERHWLPLGEPMGEPMGVSAATPLAPSPKPLQGLLARRVWREVPAQPRTGGSLMLSGLGTSRPAWIETLQHLQPDMTVLDEAYLLGQSAAIAAPPVRVWHFSESEPETALIELLRLCQAALRSPDRAVELVAIATGATAAMQAAFLRTLVAEYPQVAAASLAVEALPWTAAALLPLCLQMPALQPGAAKELAMQSKGFQERGWEDCLAATVSAPAAQFRQQGVYLISGGAGGLGRLLARHLAQTYHARVALLGRKRFRTDSVRLIQNIKDLGGEAIYVCTDITHAEAVQEAVRRTRQRFGVIHGVIHAAGILEDRLLADKDEDSLRRVLGPKLAGARLLDRATQNDPLDFFLLFSSLAAVVGNPGQADYAAANAFLEHFATQRSRRSLAIHWSLWQEGGMQMPAETLPAVFAQTGMAPLPTAEGLAMIEQALASGETSLIAAWGDPVRLRSCLGVRHPAPPDAPLDAPLDAPPKSSQTIAPSVPVSPDHDARATIATHLRQLFSQELKIEPQRLDPTAGLDVYGIDSVSIRRLTTQLETQFGALPKTLLFHYKTIAELTTYLAQRPAAPPPVSGSLDSEPDSEADVPVAVPSEESPPPDPLTHHPDAIAIIGVHGRFPGAESLDELWALLREGREAIRDVPPERWNHALFYDSQPGHPAKTYARWGGFLNDVDQFDPLFFGITPKDAELIDPQERLFLESAWLALEDAGYHTETLQRHNQRVGVFAGVTWGSYQLFGAEAWGKGQVVFPNSSFWSVANRVSYTLDLHGPSLPVDTACSASLSAIHLACESLRRGECDRAIAGGVNLYLHPSKFVQMAQLRFASTDGKCRSFGEGGDGYVPGEGVGTVILKPLAAAQRDRDHIYAVILGSAMNHGGKTNGYTVPNPNAQAEVVQLALQRSGIAAQTISYIEAHGTGTALGDPIEIDGLRAAFESEPQGSAGQCALGSIKSNIGHLESAAGIAGLCKILLQLKHRQLVPSLHGERPNLAIDFASSPFRLQTTPAVWVSEGPRRAGLSSFGAGGSNAHLIVEEYVEKNPDVPRLGGETEPELILLSARIERLLAIAARQLADHLRQHPDLRLSDVAFTLQVGRRAFDHRLALHATTIDQVCEQLDIYLQGGSSDDVWLGIASPDVSDRPTPPPRDRRSLAAHWVTGGTIQWETLPRTSQPGRVSLPGSPFERRRCWITTPPPSTPPPIIIEERVDRHDPIVQQHRVMGVPTLAGATLLELVRRAMTRAGWVTPNLFEDVIWRQRADLPSPSLNLRISLSPESNGVTFAIGNTANETYATGRIRWDEAATEPQPVPEAFAALLAGGDRGKPQEQFYAAFEQAGVTYGTLFQGIKEIHLLANGAVARFAIQGMEATQYGESVILDAAFQTVKAELQRHGQRHGRSAALWLPFGVASVRLFDTLPPTGTILVRRSDPGDRTTDETDDRSIVRVHLAILNDDGRMVAHIEHFCVKWVKPAPIERSPQPDLKQPDLKQPDLAQSDLEHWLLPVLEGLARGEHALEDTQRLLEDIATLT